MTAGTGAAAMQQADDLLRRGRYSDALAGYDADHAEAHNNRGNVLRDLGRIEEAAAAYRESLSVNPRNAACAIKIQAQRPT